MASLVSTSDIPDWCYYGIGVHPTLPLPPLCQEYVSDMFRASPIRNVEYVSTPTLLLLGKKDLRVPNQQGMEFFHALRSQGTAAR